MALLPLLTAVVIAVSDGDTIQASAAGRSVTIHLACIDAPELGQTPQGETAKSTLLRILPRGAQISVTPLQTDRKSQVSAVVFRGTENINLKMARSGQAFSIAGQEDQCDFLRFADAQNQAEIQRLGVWMIDGGIQRPWAYRAEKTNKEADPPHPYRGPSHVNLGVITGTSSQQYQEKPQATQTGRDIFTSECNASFNSSYKQRRGYAPPAGLSRDYCECTYFAISSGDTFTKAVEFCSKRFL